MAEHTVSSRKRNEYRLQKLKEKIEYAEGFRKKKKPRNWNNYTNFYKYLGDPKRSPLNQKKPQIPFSDVGDDEINKNLNNTFSEKSTGEFS
jgi:hypothetical protein